MVLKMKLCKNCKYSEGQDEFMACLHPKNMNSKKDPVTGKNKRYFTYNFCSTQRLGGIFSAFISNTCGNTGKWYKENE